MQSEWQEHSFTHISLLQITLKSSRCKLHSIAGTNTPGSSMSVRRTATIRMCTTDLSSQKKLTYKYLHAHKSHTHNSSLVWICAFGSANENLSVEWPLSATVLISCYVHLTLASLTAWSCLAN